MRRSRRRDAPGLTQDASAGAHACSLGPATAAGAAWGATARASLAPGRLALVSVGEAALHRRRRNSPAASRNPALPSGAAVRPPARRQRGQPWADLAPRLRAIGQQRVRALRPTPEQLGLHVRLVDQPVPRSSPARPASPARAPPRPAPGRPGRANRRWRRSARATRAGSRPGRPPSSPRRRARQQRRRRPAPAPRPRRRTAPRPSTCRPNRTAPIAPARRGSARPPARPRAGRGRPTPRGGGLTHRPPPSTARLVHAPARRAGAPPVAWWERPEA